MTTIEEVMRPDLVRQVLETLDRQRQITVVGNGGMGKTVLAHQVIKKWVETSPNQQKRTAVFVSFLQHYVDLSSHADVATKRETKQYSKLGDWYEKGEDLKLLVLDNCEDPESHLVSEFVAEIRCRSQIRILMTSRRVLGIPGECKLEMPRMTLPSGDGEGLTATFESEAGRMFLNACKHKFSGFREEGGAAPELAGILHSTGGVPLIIRLIVGAMQRYDVKDLYERMRSDGLIRDLERVAQEIPEWLGYKRGGVVAALAWALRAVEAVDPAAKALADRLSVYRSGWTRNSVVSICSLRGEPAAPTISRVSERLRVLQDHLVVEVPRDQRNSQSGRYLPLIEHAMRHINGFQSGAEEEE